MYKILTYKKLAVYSGAVCVMLILCAIFSAVSPAVMALSFKKQQLIVIMYHQISENKKLWGDYVLPEKLLRDDFLYLKENGYTPISVSELFGFVEGKNELPEKAVLITFDDGERSIITKVLPLLTEFKYPAVVSVVGSLSDLYSANGETNDRYAYLNWNDIKELSENELIEIGNHSYNMHTLGARRGMGRKKGESTESYLKIISDDIDKLQNLVYEHTGEKPRILAYPYGIRNDALMNLSKEKGFIVTLTCRECVNELSVGDELYELGRFNRPYGKSSEVFFENL